MDFEDDDLQEAMRRAQEGFDLAMSMELPQAPGAEAERVRMMPELDLTEPVAAPPTRMAEAPKQAPQAPPPAAGDAPFADDEFAAAMDADMRTRQAMALERAGRNLVGAFSAQTPQGLVMRAPDAAAALLARRRQADADAIAQANAEARGMTAETYRQQVEANVAAKPEEAALRREAEARQAAELALQTETTKRAGDLREREVAVKEGLAKKKTTKGAGKATTGKMLPPSTIEGLADLPSALAEVEKLDEKFRALGMDSAGAKVGSFFTGLLGLQGTDAAAYNAAAMLAMQGVGKIMEGGKLAAGDEMKYRAMLPRAGDSQEVAQQKVRGAATYLMGLVNNRVSALKEAGYAVPERALAPPAQATPSPQSTVQVIDADGDVLTLSPAAAKRFVESGRGRYAQ